MLGNFVAQRRLRVSVAVPLLFAIALSSQTLALLGLYLICLIVSVAVHEYAHALVADRLGDPTPERDGRVSLNPIVHADPVGTLILPIVATFTALPLLGWGRPVETQPSNYTRKISMRSGMALVAVAGPFANFVLAVVTLCIAAALARTVGVSQGVHLVLITLLQLNVLLLMFNLLPVHPLDGGKILAAFLPPRLEYIDDFLLRYGGWIVLGLVVFGGPVLGRALAPVFELVQRMYSVAVAG